MALLHESAHKQQLPAEQLTLRIEATDIPTLGDVKQVNLLHMVLLNHSLDMAQLQTTAEKVL